MASEPGARASARSLADARRTIAGALSPGERARLRLLGRVAAGVGARLYLVGGPVRDLLLGVPLVPAEKETHPDFDLAVEGDTRRVGTALARALGGRFVYHSRFLTGTLVLPAGDRLDLARTRTETYPQPAVLPTVRPASLETDLSRRDFTINALAFELSPGRFGRLYDPMSGCDDILQRRVRVLHSQSFRDDPTRIFRAIRFAVRLEFEIEPTTLRHLRAAIATGLPARLTPERLLYELRCFCAEEHAPRMFEAALHERLLQSGFAWRPQPGFLPGLLRLNRRTRDPELLFLYVLAALPDAPRFPVTREQREAARAIRQAPALRARLARAKRPSTIYRLLEPIPVSALPVIAAGNSPAAARAVRTYLDRSADARPLLDSRELKALGLRPGPDFGRVIEKLRAARLDGRVRTREEETAFVRRMLARKKR